ncbi:MAG TPA: FAD-dependent oxidoreductase, partial [Phycisphaerae bacterium]|nr:FAD-dependent oxidoreductase [Phycisphaerae bacterium]
PVALLGSETCGDLVGAFRFGRPEDYRFKAGQHLILTLRTSEGPQRKVFTIASAPDDDYLEVCTRLSGSAFKRALLGLDPGASVEISAASGRLALAPDDATTAFLVGGVGVTPARSMIRDSMAEGRTERIALFFGDRSPKCMWYAKEFASIAERTSRLTYVPVVEHPDPSWTGETGFITADTVRRHVVSPERLRWIISGPPVMVDAMRRVAAELDIPAAHLQVEIFGGYRSASQ